MSYRDDNIASPENVLENKITILASKWGVSAKTDPKIDRIAKKAEYFIGALALLKSRLGAGYDALDKFDHAEAYVQDDYFSGYSFGMTESEKKDANKLLKSFVSDMLNDLKEKYPVALVGFDEDVTPRIMATQQAETIPAALLEDYPFSTDALQNKLKEIEQAVDHIQSPYELSAYLEKNLLPHLKIVHARIDQLTSPDMSPEAQELIAGDLIDHAFVLEQIKSEKMQKLPVLQKNGLVFDGVEVEELAAESVDFSDFEPPHHSPSQHASDIEVIDLGEVIEVGDEIVPQEQEDPLSKLIEQSVLLDNMVSKLDGDDLKKFCQETLFPLSVATVNETILREKGKIGDNWMKDIPNDKLSKHSNFLTQLREKARDKLPKPVVAVQPVVQQPVKRDAYLNALETHIKQEINKRSGQDLLDYHATVIKKRLSQYEELADIAEESGDSAKINRALDQLTIYQSASIQAIAKLTRERVNAGDIQPTTSKPVLEQVGEKNDGQDQYAATQPPENYVEETIESNPSGLGSWLKEKWRNASPVAKTVATVGVAVGAAMGAVKAAKYVGAKLGLASIFALSAQNAANLPESPQQQPTPAVKQSVAPVTAEAPSTTVIIAEKPSGGEIAPVVVTAKASSDTVKKTGGVATRSFAPQVNKGYDVHPAVIDGVQLKKTGADTVERMCQQGFQSWVCQNSPKNI